MLFDHGGLIVLLLETGEVVPLVRVLAVVVQLFRPVEITDVAVVLGPHRVIPLNFIQKSTFRHAFTNKETRLRADEKNIWFGEICGLGGLSRMEANVGRDGQAPYLSGEYIVSQNYMTQGTGLGDGAAGEKKASRLTLRDLLGVDMDFAQNLPPESKSEDGFKNNGLTIRMGWRSSPLGC